MKRRDTITRDVAEGAARGGTCIGRPRTLSTAAREGPSRRAVLLRSVVVALALAVQGCATFVEGLEEELAEGAHSVVLKQADEWLKSEAEDAPRKLRHKVEVLRARALLAMTREQDTVLAYKYFRAELGRAEHLAEVSAEALELESRIWFRRELMTSDTVASCERFRELYPDSSLWKESRRIESQRAYLKVVEAGTIADHQTFRALYGDWPEAEETLRASRQGELALAFGAARERGTPEALAKFRATYEGWKEAGDSVRAARYLEFQLAREKAERSGTADTFQRLRTTYGDWPEAAEHLASIRRKEVDLSHAEARAAAGAAGLRRFRRDYGEWPEAQLLLPQAYQDELARALEAAIRSDDPEELVAYRVLYPDEPEWHGRSWRAEARMVVGAVLAMVEVQEPMETDAVDAWLARNAALPPVQDEAAPHEADLWNWAQLTGVASSFRLFGGLYPRSQHAGEARALEWELAWTEAEEASRLETSPRVAMLRFFERYPDHPRALQAERRHHNLNRLERMERASQRATIAATRIGSGNTVDLHVDVRDCHGRRVSGLNRRDFGVFIDGDAVPLQDFAGLEEARPVDIVFEIDLSGSMGTEIHAVQAAVIQFAEVFRFRQRRTRLGLIAFSDDIIRSTQLTGNVEEFQRQVAALSGMMQGGNGEDGAHALLKASQMLDSSPAERVSILLSDEPLQINLGGRQALGGSASDECTRARRVAACLKRCRNNNASCVTQCMMALDAATGRAIQACVAREGAQRCAWAYGGHDLANRLGRCITPVHEYSEEMGRLAERLDKARVRPYLLVPEGLSGFGELARRTQGQLIPVPDDGSDPGPYVEALMEVADQLSRQYVLTLPPGAMRPGARVNVLARSGHVWVERSALPSQGALGLFPVPGGPADCPEFLLVTAADGVFLSDQCASAWARIDGGRLTAPLTAAVAHDDGVMALDARGRVHLFSMRNGQMTSTDLTDVARITPGPGGSALLVRREAPGGPWSLGPPPPASSILSVGGTEPHAPIPLYHPEGGAVCLLTRHDKMSCMQDDAESEVPVEGLPGDLLASNARVLPAPGREGVFLATTERGEVLRSIDGGRHWRQMLAPDGERRDLVFLPGTPAVACTTSSRTTQCSDDSGLSWFQVGRDFDAADRSAIAWDGRGLFVAQGGQLQRLDRVINREIPSTSVYFNSNARTPSASMLPFLQDIARAMEAAPSLVLRVEGHADHRGSTEYNQQLAADRAASIIAHVQAMGIAAARLQTVSYGERRPVTKRSDADALAMNRRVELILLSPGAQLAPTATQSNAEPCP
jgi:peptidoglycan-associated lipoprotein